MSRDTRIPIKVLPPHNGFGIGVSMLDAFGLKGLGILELSQLKPECFIKCDKYGIEL